MVFDEYRERGLDKKWQSLVWEKGLKMSLRELQTFRIALE